MLTLLFLCRARNGFSKLWRARLIFTSFVWLGNTINKMASVVSEKEREREGRSDGGREKETE